MKFKRLLSLALCIVMMFSMSIDTFATVLNINLDGENVTQVNTDTNQFFNVTFAPMEWEPNAEQVCTMYMGLSYDMWRHSGDQQKNKPGDQRWNTPFGYLTDYEMGQVMIGKYSDAVVYQNQVLPDGVRNFLSNGGSWEDIKVTFQCANSDDRFLDHNQIFQNGAVDAWLKWGTEIQLAFKPYFKGSTEFITNHTATKITRAEYPYSNTMFSMFKKGGGHRGATMVHDPENGEPKDKYTSQGFDSLLFSDIINSNGDLTPGKSLKNIELSASGCGCSSHPTIIDTNTVRIGNGSTFNSGGAIGISFHFPVKITFEINPIQEKKGNALYVSEYSIVNMADDADPDEMTTHASMQAYSNREQ